MRSRIARGFVALATASMLTSCYFVRSPSRPVPGLTFLRDGHHRAECLVIFLPGFLDGPDTFANYGFPDALLRSGARCDSVAVDLHLRYYSDGGIDEILYQDILGIAEARGYRKIWLVGISMGGLGASMLARAHGDLLEGVILLSPFLGDESVIRSIEDEGGLASWNSPEHLSETLSRDAYTAQLWAWFQGYTRGADRPRLYLGWANDERLAPAAELLAAALPDAHVAAIDGAHKWTTWRPLFRVLLERARIGRER